MRSYGLAPGSPSRLLAAVVIRRKLDQAIPPEHRRFYEKTGSCIQLGDYLAVHAGVRPGVPLEEQTLADLLSIRQRFLQFDGDFGFVVVHGHTPVMAPELRPNRINIDTGAFATNRLTCLKIDADGARVLQNDSLEAHFSGAAPDQATPIEPNMAGNSLIEAGVGDQTGIRRGDPHSVLGVSRRASTREVRAAYLRLVKALHPDGRVEDPIAAERRTSARRARAVFVISFLTSSASVLLVLFAYYTGLSGPQDEQSTLAAKPQSFVIGLTTTSKHPAGTEEGREMAWAEAERTGSREAWQRFIEVYPEGDHAAKAKQTLAAIDAAEARQRADLAAWAAAEKGGTRAALRGYLDAYPEGDHAAKAKQTLAAIDAAEARQRADLAAWAAAEKSGTRAALRGYLDAYPHGNHAADARQALAAVDAAEARQRADLAAWAAAEKSGTRAALRGYLDVYPHGNHTADARQALADIDAAEARQRADRAAWAEAEKSGARAALRWYLSTYPSGDHTAEAKQRLALLEAEEDKRAQDDTSWSKAVLGNSRASYAAYLGAHPNGRQVGDARARIAGLERVEAKALAAAVLKDAKPAPQAARQGAPAPASAQRSPFADEPSIGADGRIRR